MRKNYNLNTSAQCEGNGCMQAKESYKVDQMRRSQQRQINHPNWWLLHRNNSLVSPTNDVLRLEKLQLRSFKQNRYLFGKHHKWPNLKQCIRRALRVNRTNF